MEKKTENATKFAQTIARMRKSGLTVIDRTSKGVCIGITGVHKPREGCAELEKKTEKATKLSQAIAKMLESGLVVTDQTRKGGGIGFIGGVRLPAKKN